MSKINSLAFVIFTYNSDELIERNLKHIKAAIDYFPIEHEIILVDNNSTDNTLEIVKVFSEKNQLDIKIIENPHQGLSFSRIEGIKVASKEYVSFIDDDNFISKKWIKTLTDIIETYNPDVIGCQVVGIADVPFPGWWEKYQGTYACGKRFNFTGFLTNPVHKVWGAGLTARLNYLKRGLLNMDLLCTGRIGNKQMAGEDVELNYRMRLMGATFYNSNNLSLEHFMKKERLTKRHLKKTRIGNGNALVFIEIYKYLLTKQIGYNLVFLAFIMLFAAPFLSLCLRINYFRFIPIRFFSLKKRISLQGEIKNEFCCTER